MAMYGYFRVTAEPALYRLVKHIPGTDFDSPRRFLDVSDLESDDHDSNVEPPVRSRAGTPLGSGTADEKKTRRLQKLQSTSFFTTETDIFTSPQGSRSVSGVSIPVRPSSPGFSAPAPAGMPAAPG